ncbi:hypothetical protein HYALB_00007141 [Hymenoscyphus albidus]|uniref:Uncharacterized protein n=1 Tax=Hymenoscyphus albidus TaxID=595503 RepID=A0A9N9PRF9_9HELO|nr:hypothetical protein HYALB_00007141 [Hymenoscyphus albidus]
MEGHEYSKYYGHVYDVNHEVVGELDSKAFEQFERGLPKRPGYNTTGKQIAVRVNQYKVNKFPTMDVGQYDINYGLRPDQESKRGLLKAIFDSSDMQRELNKHNPFWLWDGNKLLWSICQVPEIRVTVDLDKAKGRTPRDGQKPDTYRVRIVRTKRVRMDMVRAYIEGKIDFDNSVYEGINFLDHLMRQGPSERGDLVSQKRSYFSRTGNNYAPLDNLIGASKGVYQSIRLCDPNGGSGLGINVDVANGTFWSGQELIQAVRNYTMMVTRDRSLDYNTLTQRLAPVAYKNGYTQSAPFKELRKMSKLQFKLKCQPLGSKPVANPDQVKHKVFTIKNFAWDTKYGAAGCTPKTKTFELTDKPSGKKRMISVYDYFKEKYGFICNQPHLPLIETTRDGFIPMEACLLLGFQKYQYKLDPTQTAAMIKFAVTRPKQRLDSIMSGVNMLNWGTDRYHKAFGLEIDRNFTVTNAKLLQNPEIQFKGSKHNPGTSGRWDLRGKKLWIPNQQPLKSWGCLVLDGCMDEASCKNFMNVFMQTYIGHGGIVANKNPSIVVSPRGADVYASAIRFRNTVGNANQLSPQIIFIIMSQRDSFMYERLKKIMECRFGMVSQMIAVTHAKKAAPQYCSNVSMKVNAKLGGVTCRVNTPAPKAFPIPTMIIGADVSHASPGSEQASIAAITMSMDPDCLKFAAHVQTNGRRVEMISEENIRGGFMSLFKYWVENARTGPQHIYYFRDGVSEGQYQAVLNDEVFRMKQALEEVYQEKAKAIKWTVTVCSKRHHIRFFPKEGDSQAGDRNGNALPGTLVERDVTHPFHYDFYLSSHSAIQGTARPTHYSVLEDQMQLKPSDFQNMIYKHCYQYARSTTPVSLYPAVYYAHLASNRARAHFPEDISLGAKGGQKFVEKKEDEVVLRAMGKGSKGPSSRSGSNKETTEALPLIPLAMDSKDPVFIKAIRTSMWYI